MHASHRIDLLGLHSLSLNLNSVKSTFRQVDGVGQLEWAYFYLGLQLVTALVALILVLALQVPSSHVYMLSDVLACSVGYSI